MENVQPIRKNLVILILLGFIGIVSLCFRFSSGWPGILPASIFFLSNCIFIVYYVRREDVMTELEKRIGLIYMFIAAMKIIGLVADHASR